MKMQRMRRWGVIVLRIASTAGFIFSAICTFLGAAPGSVIQAVLGPDIVRHLLHFRDGVLNMTAEQARWFLVIQGDFLFGMSLFYFFYLHFRKKISKIEKTNEETGRMVADIGTSVSTAMADARRRLVSAKKSERSARKLHDHAYKMLLKIREAKTDKRNG
jgi:hypothetical protein